MQLRQRAGKCSQPCLGMLTSLIGLLFISLIGGHSIPFWLSTALCIGGFVLCIFGGSLLWLEGNVEPASCAETTAPFAGEYLGEVYLNGYCLAAYGCEVSSSRKQFRLICSPPMGSVKEAALVRYMVREGLMHSCGQNKTNRSRTKRTGRFSHKREECKKKANHG